LRFATPSGSSSFCGADSAKLHQPRAQQTQRESPWQIEAAIGAAAAAEATEAEVGVEAAAGTVAGIVEVRLLRAKIGNGPRRRISSTWASTWTSASRSGLMAGEKVKGPPSLLPLSPRHNPSSGHG